MEAQFWHQRWESGRIGFHQRGINPYLTRFWSRFEVPAGAEVFVPLCGKSLDMIWLAGHGYRVAGIELSPVAVENFFAENDLVPERHRDGPLEWWCAGAIRIACGDFFALESRHLDGIGFVFDRASLVALPREMRPDYVGKLGELLPGYEMLLVTLEYDQREMAGPPFSVVADEVQSLFAAARRVEEFEALEVLDENPHFRGKGLTRLVEKAFAISAG